MTNLERDNRKLLLDYILENVGGTELNPMIKVRQVGAALEIEYEDGSKQIASIIVTDSDE